MYFKLFFDEQLAHMSYLIGCQKTVEAIVIDPARDEDQLDEIPKDKKIITHCRLERVLQLAPACSSKRL
jgi:hydroxyacylglutathione hydrolase